MSKTPISQRQTIPLSIQTYMIGQHHNDEAFETTLRRDLTPKPDIANADANQTMSSYFTVKPRIDKPEAQKIYEVARTA